jgi:hypothetical protein
MEMNEEYWKRYKYNNLLYQFITREWFFREKSEGLKIFQKGGKLYDFRDGVIITELLGYYEGLEKYNQCYLLKCVLDGLKESSA